MMSINQQCVSFQQLEFKIVGPRHKGPNEFENFVGPLTKLCETCTIKDYIATFEKLANMTMDL